MNQVEIIKAILAGEALEWLSPYVGWDDFHGIGHPTLLLESYLAAYQRFEFRLKPKTVRYQTRAYLYEGRVLVWVSSYSQNPAEYETGMANLGTPIRWLEETQEKEYTL